MRGEISTCCLCIPFVCACRLPSRHCCARGIYCKQSMLHIQNNHAQNVGFKPPAACASPLCVRADSPAGTAVQEAFDGLQAEYAALKTMVIQNQREVSYLACESGF